MKKPKAEGCRWFLLCKNKATTKQHHPILGDVPICARCKAWYERQSAATQRPAGT